MFAYMSIVTEERNRTPAQRLVGMARAADAELRAAEMAAWQSRPGR